MIEDLMSEQPANKESVAKDFRVLVVDDEPEVAKAIAKLVASRGFRAAVTTSGKSALSNFDKHEFDLVLVDLAMPEMNGWQVLAELRKRKKQARVIIMTGFVPKEGEAILSDRKADGYLVKPIDAARLDAMLRALLFSQNLGRPTEAVAVDDEPSILPNEAYSFIRSRTFSPPSRTSRNRPPT